MAQTRVLPYNARVIPFTSWRVFCFRSDRGENQIKAWLDQEKISVNQRAAFQAKIDALERGGPDLSQGFITSTPVAKNIYKMKVRGPVQLRPMACKGPINEGSEFTILVGWIERNNEKLPNDVVAKAQHVRQAIIADPDRRIRERLS